MNALEKPDSILSFTQWGKIQKKLGIGLGIMKVSYAGNLHNRSERNYLFAALPLLIFLVIVILLANGLTLNPNFVPSALIDKPVPVFDLPPVGTGISGLSNTDLIGDVSLLNVFASWCPGCLVEHPVFMRLAETGTVPVYGISYKDKIPDTLSWLGRHGNPYTRIGADLDGRVGIDWGVYGVPETYIINKEGLIVYKHIGPVSQADMESIILPQVEMLQARRE